MEWLNRAPVHHLLELEKAQYLRLQGDGSDVALADVPVPGLGFLQHCVLGLGDAQALRQGPLERQLGVFVALQPRLSSAPQMRLAVLQRLFQEVLVLFQVLGLHVSILGKKKIEEPEITRNTASHQSLYAHLRLTSWRASHGAVRTKRRTSRSSM